MPWQRWRFKQNKVYVRVLEAGSLASEDARVEMRYKLTDPRAYQVSPASLSPLTEADGGAELWPDDAAVPADPSALAGKKTPSSGGSKASGTSKSIGTSKSSSGTKSAASKATTEASAQEGASDQEGAEIAQVGAGGASGASDARTIVVYTDGACSGNPGPAGLGVVLMAGARRKELSEYLGEATSNIAELMAVKRALESIKDPTRPVRLHTDSAYSIGVLSQGWKAKANQALIAEVRALMATFPHLKLIKVAGHAGIEENERCDQLARDAIERGRRGG